MAVAVFDTYKAVSLLQKRGLSKEAAEGITELLKDVTENNLVTKSDLNNAVQALELALHKQTATIIKWVTGILIAHAALVVSLVERISRR